MDNQIFKSAFFNNLHSVRNEWAKDTKHEVVSQMDEIAYTIENSSEHNKRVLEGKCNNLISCWKNCLKNPIEKSKLKMMNLDEYLATNPDVEQKSNIEYEYYSCYTGLFSEIKAYDYLLHEGYGNICFLEEGKSKTPDFHMDDNVYCEVKNINSPREDEYRLKGRVAEAVEINEDFKSKLLKKISDVVQDSINKFESVNAPQSKDKRLLILNVILGTVAAVDVDKSYNFIKSEMKRLEAKYTISIIMIDTFSKK